MVDILLWILGLILFIVVICASIAVHEAGHMFVAKRLGIPVPRFFVGFGKTLWSKKAGETEYGVKAIPLGGFVEVIDETQPKDSPDRQLLSYVSPWKRFLVFIAGPAVNMVVGFLILFVLLVSTTAYAATTVIQSVNPCTQSSANCAADKGGLKPGDNIVSINGNQVDSRSDFASFLKAGGNDIGVVRDGVLTHLTLTPNENMKLGVLLKMEERVRTPSEAFDLMGTLMYRNLEAISKIPEKTPHLIRAAMGQEERDANTISSVVGVGKVYGETSQARDIDTDSKIKMFVMYSALLNIGLGLGNLLPLLPLDGGRILISFIDFVKMGWDKLRRREYTPTGYNLVSSMTIVTGSMLLAFMLLLIVADIVSPVSIR